MDNCPSSFDVYAMMITFQLIFNNNHAIYEIIPMYGKEQEPTHRMFMNKFLCAFPHGLA